MITNEFDETEPVFWYMWEKKTEQKEKRCKDGKKKQYSVKLTIKSKKEGTLGELISLFEKKMIQFVKHVHNWYNQHTEYKKAIENTKQGTSAVVHMDFSENWQCKYGSEIQSVHFGSSNAQVTLHTSVVFVTDNNGKESKSFCTMSDSKRHDAAAIWGHLDPVLKFLRENHRDVDTVHFFSDGPTTQYRNRFNFHLFTNSVFQYGFSKATWNFFEAGHGKGAADGVGGLIKRTADDLVAKGGDIPDVSTLFSAIEGKDLNVNLFLVDEGDICHFDDKLPDCIKPVKGTMKLHQVQTFTPGQLLTRDTSCFCTDGFCSCHGLKKHFHLSQNNLQHDIELPPENIVNQVNTGQNVSNEFDFFQPINEFGDNLQDMYCFVRYEGKCYPGIIKDVDDSSVEVQVMKPIGRNKYVWPTPSDQIWYEKDDVVCLVPDPNPGKRFSYFESDIWNKIEKFIDFDN